MHMIRITCGLALAVGCMAASAVPGNAEMARIGILSCDVSQGVGEILARKQALACQFEPDQGAPESYAGSIDGYGVEIGKVDQGHMIWGVASATSGVTPGALAGRYVGVGAEAALGVVPEPTRWWAEATSPSHCNRCLSTARPESISQRACSRSL